MNKLFRENRLATGIFVAFLIVAGIAAALAFSTVRDLVLSWNITGVGQTPPLSISAAEPTPQLDTPVATVAPNVPLQPGAGPEPKPWDGTSQVTILVMGLDYRDWAEGQGPPRTDTMILLTVDPATNSAGMLSIPRDLWTPIPGFGNGKINTAYQLGESHQLPGGGPGLAVATVEQLLGMPIHFYAQVDFGAFVRMIDEIGGVKLDIPEKIKIDPLGPDNTKTLKPGVQTLPGEIALAYARARNTQGGDFDRARRQQQVIIAIRDRVLDFDLAPVLITKAPGLYQEISGGIRTNMTLEQAIRLGLLVQQIPKNNIRRGVIGIEQVTFGKSPAGLDILKPIPDKIRVLRDEIFSAGNVVSHVAQEKTLAELIAEENAAVAVLNGTFTAGLASETTEFLKEHGINVTVTGNAPQAYGETTLIDYTGNPYTLQYLIDTMDIRPNRVFHSFDPESKVDIEVNLGADWANSDKRP